MARRAGVAWKAALVLVLAAFLQGAGCHAHVCSGDGCDEDDDPNGDSGTQLLVLPPLRDPLGRLLIWPLWFAGGLPGMQPRSAAGDSGSGPPSGRSRAE